MILIVDDDSDFVEIVGKVLEKAGHRVVSANNREDGHAPFAKIRSSIF